MDRKYKIRCLLYTFELILIFWRAYGEKISWNLNKINSIDKEEYFSDRWYKNYSLNKRIIKTINYWLICLIKYTNTNPRSI